MVDVGVRQCIIHLTTTIHLIMVAVIMVVITADIMVRIIQAVVATITVEIAVTDHPIAEEIGKH